MAHIDHNQPNHHRHFRLIRGATRLYGKLLAYIGDRIIGRAHAGRVGRVCRIIRVASAISSLGVGISVLIIAGTSVYTGGTAIPLWILIIGGASIVINSTAIVIGSGANHQKISQYYDRQAYMHIINVDISDELSINPRQLPHGITQYWRAERSLFWMVIGRRLHDLNAYGGTGLSIVSGLASLGVATISPEVGFALLAASRGSASLSAGGANITNWHRLNVYKKINLKLASEYHLLTRRLNPIRAKLSQRIVEISMNTLNIDNHDRYAPLIKYHLYKAIYSLAYHHSHHCRRSVLHIAHKKNIIKEIITCIAPLLVKNGANNRFQRSQIKKIDVHCNYFTSRQSRFNNDLSVLDGLLVFDQMIQWNLLGIIEPKLEVFKQIAYALIARLNINRNANDASKLIFYHTVIALHQAHSAPINQELAYAAFSEVLSKYIKPETIRIQDGKKWFGLRKKMKIVETGQFFIDHNLIATQYPLSEHAHHTGFLATYHMSKIREELVDSFNSNGKKYQEPLFRFNRVKLTRFKLDPVTPSGSETMERYTISPKR